MTFREIQNNTTWTVYNNIIDHNINRMGKLKIPFFLKKSYSKLISFYPLTEKQENTYYSLTMNKRLPYLFNYLIKVGRKNGLKKSTINRLVELKKNYDTKKNNKHSVVEYTDRMKMYLIAKDYDSILDLHLTNDKIRSSFEIFAEYVKLLINHIIDDEMTKIKKNHKVWNTNRMAIESQMNDRETIITPGIQVGRPVYGDRVKKSKSFFDLNIKMDSVSEDVSEWDQFIESEISKRIDKQIYKLSKQSEKKNQNKYYSDSPADSIADGYIEPVGDRIRPEG